MSRKQGMIDTIFERMLCMGYFIGAVQARNVIRFFPPLNVEEIYVDKMIQGLREVLNNV
jgi:4-aminobutyrate aminotransferase-like enzyme